MKNESNRRILVVDDNAAIHDDFRKILTPANAFNAALSDAKSAFFGQSQAVDAMPQFELECASQGEDALALVKAGVSRGDHFAMAFVDVRMPPGMDGIETIARLWELDPKLHAVVCTAHADYSWNQMIAKLGHSDRLLILKKPFDPVEVQQLATALTEKWNAEAREKKRFDEARSAEQEARAYAASLVTMNRALETARSGAVAAAQAKSEFLANMSHEIRTPMIAILGHADLMQEPNLNDAERHEHATTIQEQGSHLLAMLSDILDIASIETGRLVVQKGACDVRALIDEIRARFALQAREKGLELQIECGDSIPPSISGDPARLRQVLQHLVGNALKFTDSGTIRIGCALEREFGGDPGRLQITVEDTGVGITAQQRSRLFEAFAQADGSLTRKHGGAGLGLALSRRLVQMLDGDLDVESEAGKGSRFTLSLAVQRMDAASTPTAIDSASNCGVQGRVLLVEDVPATQRLYALYLTRAGAEVDIAPNGQIAVDRVLASISEGRPYDLVLMDMQMPVLDGYSATQTLRRKGFTGPIIAVTAHAMAGDREKCIAAGCDDYCAKPADRQHLVAMSREWIHRTVPPALPRSPSQIDTPAPKSG